MPALKSLQNCWGGRLVILGFEKKKEGDCWLSFQEELHEMVRKGNERLKAEWSFVEPEEKEDAEVDALAEELEKRLHVPSEETDKKNKM